jgi:predicted GNAT superfamily acetyltransferase
MKRFLGLALALLSIGTVGLAAELKANEASTNSLATTASANGQWQRDRYGRRIYNNRRRVVRRTRVVRVGSRLYRETFVVRYLPNGRVDTRLISRVRIS